MKRAIMFMLVLMNVFSLSGCPIDTQDSKEYDPHDFYPKQEVIYTEETAMKSIDI